MACANIFADAWNSALPALQRSIRVDVFDMETKEELTLVAIIDERISGYVSIWEPD
ncbi:MAG: hypothetical protein ACJAYE_000244 [Candidatus Azotimanducaceae bacterium]